MLDATSETMRLPSTGPSVQNPMAAPRCTWGEKSRTSAGVATRTMPSTNPRRATKTPYSVFEEALGMPKAVMRLAARRPQTTRLARPHRSAKPASSEATAPATLETTTTVR